MHKKKIQRFSYKDLGNMRRQSDAGTEVRLGRGYEVPLVQI